MSIEFYRESKPIARKEHRCDLCGRMICKGDEYVNLTYKCTGEDIFAAKYHLSCHDLVNRYISILAWDDYWNEDDVIDSIHERVCCDCEKFCDYTYHEVVKCPEVISKFLVKE